LRWEEGMLTTDRVVEEVEEVERKFCKIVVAGK